MPRRVFAALGLPALLGACSPARLAGLLTPSRGTALREGLAYGPHPRQRLDLALPRDAGPATPLLVFFHGGSWQFGGRGEYLFVSRALAARGIAVAVPDYRLWPEARWPDFVQDGAAAVAWLRGPAGRAGGAPGGPLFVAGHSAGGYIAAALALDPRWLGGTALPGGRGALAGGVLLAAPISWQPRDEPVASIFAAAPGGRIEAVPEAAALRGAPPMLLVHGTADTVVGPFHSVDLAAALEAAGRPARLRLIEGAGHIGVLAAVAEPVRAFGFSRGDVLGEVVGFVREMR
jgi:acetyl esterase/lipase